MNISVIGAGQMGNGIAHVFAVQAEKEETLHQIPNDSRRRFDRDAFFFYFLDKLICKLFVVFCMLHHTFGRYLADKVIKICLAKIFEQGIVVPREQKTF